ncbi:3-dehydroquinate synthase [Methylopila jiangsuensis]|uniref:3-dehydroquinate synthase n=1 Tax=Methylopila jiangsuensis TaxID=586230 RepID=A0A9W6N4P1_9HYPH|nr:3-dehydroquinate synthase [Methylopila jiangsuensis]MDR6285080.1 3-dehydroquinate synthase [Methylopila jiangsuensis]GLK77533.1 3-dehydroquinate synthase [Methylopila jiangsuensis]
MTDAALSPQATDGAVVRVALGDRAYDIVIGHGVLREAGARARALGARKVAVVTDENVAKAHLPTALGALADAGLDARAVTVAAGEASKCMSTLAEVTDQLIAARIERGDLVLALGGGVVGDLAGFAAAILRRGVRCLQAPTSLLAQVDSSVGGKTGVNSRYGKNLIGAFHQPSLVLADVDTLDTLPPREFRAGYAEVAKYGLIDDEALFGWLERSWEEIFAGGPARIEAIAASCRSKAAIVARDEHEHGDRALLNLGHTFGHALEADVAYDGSRLVHGEGVAIGMAMAFRFSAALGLCAPDDARRVERHLQAVGLPTSPKAVPGGVSDADTLLEHMRQDKKVSGGRLTFILARGVGRSFVAKDVDADKALAFLKTELA